jgi:hypothetical protein
VKIKIEKGTAKFVMPSAPRDVRFMAAGGMIPISPQEVIKALFILSHDRDTEIKKKALTTLVNFSPEILINLISGDMPPSIIDFIVRHHKKSHLFYEGAIKNKNTADETIAFLATKNQLSLIDIISVNHERLSRSPAIVSALLKNPSVKGVTRQRLMEYIGGEEIDTPVVKEAEESHVMDSSEKTPGEDEASRESGGKPIGESTGESADTDEEENLDGLSLMQQVQRMSIPEKIKLAQRGSKEARTLLLKDPNRLVVAEVVKSPKITEGEILMLAQSKQSGDEILRLITINREWMKNYAIRHALVTNPKTPVGVSLRVMNTLNKRDLKEIQKSKNIPTVISTNARKILALKEKKGS